MDQTLYPLATVAMSERRKKLAPEMRAGGAYAHSALARDVLDETPSGHQHQH